MRLQQSYIPQRAFVTSRSIAVWQNEQYNYCDGRFQGRSFPKRKLATCIWPKIYQNMVSPNMFALIVLPQCWKGSESWFAWFASSTTALRAWCQISSLSGGSKTLIMVDSVLIPTPINYHQIVCYVRHSFRNSWIPLPALWVICVGIRTSNSCACSSTQQLHTGGGQAQTQIEIPRNT